MLLWLQFGDSRWLRIKREKKLTGKEIDSMTDDEFSAVMHELADSVEEDTLVSV